MEPEALLTAAVNAKQLDPEKGRAALTVYAELQKRGAQFTFGQFLVERGLLSNIALNALEGHGGKPVRAVDSVGDFQFLELIGEGAHGAVYKALQKSLNRPVALKILSNELARDPQAVATFLNEARATARLTHMNIVQSIAVGSDQGLHYFAMELCEGGSVGDLLEEHGGKLEEGLALDLIRQAAEGLKAAHATGILHRDIKPENMLLSTTGQVKLLDLGISQAMAARESGEEDVFWGSPPYVAPEVIRGTTANDPRIDIYSLGATLFELLTGRPPFVADTPEQILQMHLTAPAPDPRTLVRGITPMTAGLIRSMMAKDPAKRLPSAQAVADAIGRSLKNLRVQALVRPVKRPGTQPIRKPAYGKPVAMKRGQPLQGRPLPGHPQTVHHPARHPVVRQVPRVKRPGGR